MPDNTQKANAAPRCQYIRLNDQPCTQPALNDNVFCRFHEFLDHPLPTQQIPFVEDATTLQVALMQVIRSLQRGEINRATAGTILYALQIAAQNLKHFAEESGHPFAQPNAPRKHEKEDEEELEGPSLAEILLDRLQIIEKEDAAERAASVATPTPPPPRPSASPAVETDSPSGIIDKLEACAESQREGSLACHPERSEGPMHLPSEQSIDPSSDSRPPQDDIGTRRPHDPGTACPDRSRRVPGYVLSSLRDSRVGLDSVVAGNMKTNA